MFIIFVALLLIGFLVVEKNLKPTIRTIAEAKAKQIAVETINDVINKKIVPNVEYQDLIKIHKDGEAKVTMVQPNIIKINQVQAETAIEVNKSLKNLKKGEFKIPLGQASGTQLLANYGPRIKVNFVPIGTVNVQVKDTLYEAGINQTRHRIYFKVTCQIQVVIPLESSNVKVSSDIMVADNIILGDVPTQYVKVNMGDAGKLDLAKDTEEDK